MHLAGKTIENAGDRLSFIRRSNSSPEKPKVHHTRLFDILHLKAEYKAAHREEDIAKMLQPYAKNTSYVFRSSKARAIVDHRFDVQRGKSDMNRGKC
jgi:hypothetical protein